MATITANTGSNNWNTNGAWVGAVQPTAADDVVIPATAIVTIPTATTVLGRSCTVSASGQLAFASTTAVLTLGDSTAGAGNVAFSNAGTITLTGVGTINFISTSATQQTITTGGQTMPSYTVSGAGSSYLLSDNNTTSITATVSHTGGIFNTGGKTCSWGTFSSSGATRTLTITNSAISVNATSGTNWILSTTNLTAFNVTGSTITVTASTNFTGGAATYNNVVVTTSASAWALASANTFANLTFTGSAAKLQNYQMAGNQIITGTLTITGNSSVNRPFISSSVIGTTRTLTAAILVCTNVIDFQDITGAGAATWTTGASGATSFGDCLGNSGITFDTPVTQTHTASAGGNWSDVTKWTSRVPLPQDNVIVDVNTTGTLTADMPRMGANITFTGFTGTCSFGSIANTIFGNITLASGMTLSGTSTTTFSGRSSHTVTSAGNTYLQSLTFSSIGGTYTLQDALIVINPITVTDGTYTDSGFSTTCTIMSAISGRATTLNLTGTISLTTTSAFTIWNANSASTSVNASTANFVVSTASTNTRTFSGGGKTYGTLTYTVASSPGALVITGANTFTTLNVGSGRILTMPSATTNTVTTFNVNGAVNGYLYEPGVASNNATAPNAAPLSITGDITLDAYVALDNWTLATNTRLFTKDSGVGTTRSYNMYVVATTGTIGFQCFNSAGTALSNNNSTVAPVIANGSPLWVRACWNSGTGNLRFYTSPDGSVWTQLGTNVSTTAGTIQTTTQALEIGGHAGIGTFLTGKYYRARLFNSDLGSGAGTPVFDANFTTKTVGANTFTESSSNAATVTINGTLAQVGDGRVSLVSSSGGSAATLTKSSGVVSVNYLSIQDSTATGGAAWYAGANSTDGGGNTGWVFSAGTVTVQGKTLGEVEYSAYAVRTGLSGITLQEQKLKYYNSQTGANYISVNEAEIAFLKKRTGLWTEGSTDQLWRAYMVDVRGMTLKFSLTAMKFALFSSIGLA